MANLLQEDVRKSADILGWWHRRMRDVQYYAGSGSEFDEWVAGGGKDIGLECKMITDNSKSFAFNKVSQTQMEGMIEFEKQWNHKSFLLINFRWIDHKKGKCFALPISEFLYLQYAMPNFEEYQEKYPRNEKSIPLDYFEECVLELPRYEKGWDLRMLL